jgi:site-specific recombinase XerD
MRKRPPGSTKTARRIEDQNLELGIPLKDLANRIPEFLYDCEYRGHSPRTLQQECAVLEKLLRYLQEEGAAYCGTAQLRQFLIHVAQGGMQRGGRWGQQPARQVRPRTVRNYWGYLRTFFNWLVDEEPSLTNPFERLKPPITRPDQVRPFSEEQIHALRSAAKRTNNALRDEAILLFLLDTGVRASELCAIKNRDLDLGSHRCNVLGKGNKHRVVHFGRDTKKATSAGTITYGIQTANALSESKRSPFTLPVAVSMLYIWSRAFEAPHHKKLHA